jgi:hypothetical protein
MDGIALPGSIEIQYLEVVSEPEASPEPVELPTVPEASPEPVEPVEPVEPPSVEDSPVIQESRNASFYRVLIVVLMVIGFGVPAIVYFINKRMMIQ